MAGTFGKRAAPAYAAPVSRARPAAFAPAAAVAGYAPPPPAAREVVTSAAPRFKYAVVTPFLLVVFCVAYAMEVRYAPPGHGITVRSLIAYGALDGDLLFRAGQVWRLFTAPLLHGSLSHLIGNAVVFAIVGFMLEPLIGPRWFSALFAVGALGGALTSACVNEGNIPSVGASGAIMGVLGAAFICGASAKAGTRGRKMQTWALRLILPSLIPMAAESHTDYAAHLGGIMAGIGMGVVLWLLWSRNDDHPELGNFGAGIGATCFAIAMLAFGFGAQSGAAPLPGVAAQTVTASGLIPEEEMPAGIDVGTDKAHDLLERYPHDPRAHLLRGFAFLHDNHDLADAEEQFRQALDEKGLRDAGMPEDFRQTVTVLLALTIAYQGRPDQARALGGPLCGFAQQRLSESYDSLREQGICD